MNPAITLDAPGYSRGSTKGRNSGRMRYWWVNQNQTYRHEVQGGYLWSPKRNANGARNPFYESMREVAPGDLIFSFMDTRILAVGIAQSYCWESPKAAGIRELRPELGKYRLESESTLHGATNKVRPKDHIEILQAAAPRPIFAAPAQRKRTAIGLSDRVARRRWPRSHGPDRSRRSQPTRLSARDVNPAPADDLDIWERKLEQSDEMPRSRKQTGLR